MANDKIEFDIKVNGKKAKSSIEDIEKSQEKLEKTTTRTTKTIKANWVAIGASVVAVGAGLTTLSQKALAVEKATFGMSDATKEYIKQASIQHGLSQEIIAGFVRTGESAGMSGKEIEKMISQAVALGKKFPHESVEGFIDNLSMLNRTGEAQGFIVDVLETKYGAVDLKAMSLSKKMKALDEATAGVNKEFEKTNASKVQSAYGKIAVSISELGTTFNDMLFNTGILDLFDDLIDGAKTLVNYFRYGIKGIELSFLSMKKVALGTVSDILWSMKDLPGIGDDLKKKALELNTEYNVTVDKIDQIKKGLKEEIALNEKLNKEKNKPAKKVTLDDIKGTDTPDEQKDIEEEAKSDTKVQKQRESDLKAIATLEDKFNKEYLANIATTKQLELIAIGERYLEYEAMINKKVGLYGEDYKNTEDYINSMNQLKENFEIELEQLEKPKMFDSEELQRDFDEMMESIHDSMNSNQITPAEAILAIDDLESWASEVQSAIEKGLSLEDAMKSARAEFKDFTEETSKDTEKWKDFQTGTFVALEDAFVDFAKTGKFEFKDMANAIIADLIRIMVQQMLVRAVVGMGMGSFFGVSHTGTAEVKHTGGNIGTAPTYHTGTAQVKHTGGNIGTAPTYHTGTDAIPTYHTGKGMMGDERLIKAQVGEAIINRAGAKENQEAIKAMNSGRKLRLNDDKSAFEVVTSTPINTQSYTPIKSLTDNGTTVTNNQTKVIDNTTKAEVVFNVQAIDAQSFNGYLAKESKTIENIINRSISTNGSVKKTISQSV